MARFALSLLGPLQATLDGSVINGFAYDKVRALLAYLAVESGTAHTRDVLAGLLWPELPNAAARTNLRQALTTLRQALNDRAAQPPVLLVTHETIQFNGTCDHTLDVTAFETLLAVCATHPHRGADRCLSCARRRREALALYRGDFLAQLGVSDSAGFEGWAALTRERFHGQAREALAQQAAYCERRAAYGDAERWARRLVELEPWNEDAHQHLMRALWLGGQRSAALAHYRRCCDLLATELGVEPTPETTALYEQIRANTPHATARRHLQSAPPGDVPVATTPLLGRDAELAQLTELLELRACRLITLTGPGGVGKTRLALQAAADHHGLFSDGISLVPLAGLRAAEFVVPTIAAGLGLALDGRAAPAELLLRFLRDKDLLLVLDNFEHLLAASAWIAELLQRAPALTVLVTSRTVLHLAVEHVYPVPPLAVPPAVQRGRRLQVPPLDQLRQYDAIRLFETRVRAIAPSFVLDADTAPMVAEICRRLDGLPLAIELAAARGHMLSPAALLGRLEYRLDLLTGNTRDAPARQRTLRATIDWSYQLLTGDEQAVFGRCAVFAGGFFLDAAEAVCGASDLTTPVLDVVQALVEHGLVQPTRLTVRPPQALPDPGPRFVLLETIREYALERLTAGGTLEEVQRRHAVHIRSVAEYIEPELLGTDDVAWLGWLNVERDNVRAALQWSAQAPDGAELSLRLGTALWRYWDTWDIREGRGWLERELTRQRPVPPAVRARALGRAAEFAVRHMDLVPARAWAEASLELCGDLDDQRGSAFALHVLGLLAMAQDDLATARSHWSTSLKLFRGVSDRWGQGQALFWLGSLAKIRRDWRQARDLWTAALDQFGRAGDTPALAWTLGWLSRAARAQGDRTHAAAWYRQAVQQFLRLAELPSAGAHFVGAGLFARLAGDVARAQEWSERGLRLARDFGDVGQMAEALINLAKVAEEQGDAAAAGRLWQEALEYSRQEGYPFTDVDPLVGVGASALRQGDYEQAQACFTEILALLRSEGPGWVAAVRSMAGLASVARAREQVERAAYLGGAADAATARGTWTVGDWGRYERLSHDRTLASLRLEMATIGLAPVWDAGAALTLEQAISYALDQRGDDMAQSEAVRGHGEGSTASNTLPAT